MLCLTGFNGVNNAYGEDDVVYIEKGEKVPYSGVLFPEQLAKQLRRDLLESDKQVLRLENERSKTERLSEVIKLKDAEIELYETQNKRLVRAESASNTMSYIWFGLGILTTGVAVYGAGGLSR